MQWGQFLQTAVAYRRRQIAGIAPPREVRRINDEGQPLGTNCKGWNNCSKTVQVALQTAEDLLAAVSFGYTGHSGEH